MIYVLSTMENKMTNLTIFFVYIALWILFILILKYNQFKLNTFSYSHFFHVGALFGKFPMHEL